MLLTLDDIVDHLLGKGDRRHYVRGEHPLVDHLITWLAQTLGPYGDFA
jgi:hypothetical protein